MILGSEATVVDRNSRPINAKRNNKKKRQFKTKLCFKPPWCLGDRRSPLRDLFRISHCEINPQNKMPVCERFAFLTYFILLSSFYIASLCFSLCISVLRFFLVGSAHTRTLFVKSVAKTFVLIRKFPLPS